MPTQMNIEERERFLADLHVGIVSIPRQSRGPLTVPIWYDYEPGGQVWMITGPESIKAKLLARADRISLCAQTETAPYQYVSVEGSFTITPSSPEKLRHMAVRYLGEQQGEAYAASGGDGGIIVSFKPDNWLTVDYGKR